MQESYNRHYLGLMIGLGVLLFIILIRAAYACFNKSEDSTPQHTSRVLNEVVVANTYNPLASVTSLSKEWGFPINLERADRIIVSDFDKLCFIKESTIQSSLPFKLTYKQAYFEIEILDLKEGIPLIIGLTPTCDDIKYLNNGFALFNCNDRTLLSANGFMKHVDMLTIKKGDIIGCLYSSKTKNEITFMLNGQEFVTFDIGALSSELYPTLHSSDNTFVRYNFGGQPFAFTRANNESMGLDKLNTVKELPPVYFK